MSETMMAATNPGAVALVTAGGGGYFIRRQFLREVSFSLPGGTATFDAAFTLAPNINLGLDPKRRPGAEAVFECALRLEADGMTVETPLTGPAPRAIYRLVIELVGIVAMRHDVPEAAFGSIIVRDAMRVMFPTVRALAHRLTVEAGVPPLLLEPLAETLVWREDDTNRLVAM